MKRTLLTLFCALMSVLMWAQAPAMMDFQSLVRDASGRFLGNQAVGVQISVLQGSVTGTAVYTETHTATTNAGGLLSLTIGAGTTSDSFSAINWANGPYFIKTEMDLTGGTNYTLSQTTQLMSVPYAMYAGAAADYEDRIAALESALAACAALGDRINALEVKTSGQLKGVFSVGAAKKVQFSKGNLQYQASTGTWRFAEHQYDAIGAGNSNISATYSGWIDLFGWSTSSTSYGMSTSIDNADYSGNFVDWGQNAISNAGNAAGQWCTLSADEWNYLFNTRTDAASLWFRATVNGQAGLVVLPDGFVKGEFTYTTGVSDFTPNVYTAKEWSGLEAAGAVFLPCAGYRDGTTVAAVGTRGYYWSSTLGIATTAYDAYFSSPYLTPKHVCDRFNGSSVRLVQTLIYTVAVASSDAALGSVSGGGEYTSGDSVLLTATPAADCKFVQWSDGVTDNPRKIAVSADSIITAVFAEKYPGGGLTSRFSVSATKQVNFSRGNLQYQASTGTWRFAEHQYDAIGAGNNNISATYSGWIDLYGWSSTSIPYGVSSSNTITDYTGNFVDWGQNAISNGGNVAGQWSTLSKDEWKYLFEYRANATSLWFRAKVNGKPGVIVLPDGFEKGEFTYTTGVENFTTNVYTAAEWSDYEEAGALFLPCTGQRYGNSVADADGVFFYWSSLVYAKNTQNAYAIYCSFNISPYPTIRYRYYGFAVRLARVAQ